jgi:hypothetical protein
MANTETPKTSTTSTSTPSFPTFDPTQMWAQGQATFTKLLTESMARWQAFGDQFAAVEQQAATHAQTAVVSWSNLAKDAIAYGTQLSAEARKLSLETAKKMGIPA